MADQAADFVVSRLGMPTAPAATVVQAAAEVEPGN
jgi:cutinase